MITKFNIEDKVMHPYSERTGIVKEINIAQLRNHRGDKIIHTTYRVTITFPHPAEDRFVAMDTWFAEADLKLVK